MTTPSGEPANPQGPINALRAAADRRPDAPVLRDDHRTTTYGELAAAAGVVADELANVGVVAGDRVALLLPNSPAWPAAYYGVLLVGAVAVPLAPTHTPSILSGQLRHSRPRVVLHPAEPSDSTMAALIEAAGFTALAVRGMGPDGAGEAAAPSALTSGAMPEPGRPAVLGYSAPDLDQPVVELSHTSLSCAATTLAHEVLRLTADDIVLSCFPLNTVLGQTCGINAVVSAGASLYVPSRFDPDALSKVMAEHRVTVLATFPALLPTLYRAGERSGSDITALRTIISGGGGAVTERWRDTLAAAYGCEMLHCYGPSETAGLACATTPGHLSRAGSVGAPVTGMQVRVGDARHEAPPGATGELLVRGPHLMLGYWEEPDATERAMRGGWLHTGHGARADEDGWIYLVDGGWVGRFNGPRPDRGSRRRRWLGGRR